MNIVRRNDVPFTHKPQGDDVWYYLFDDYEVIYSEQAPQTTLLWHHHEYISETTYVIDGELTAHWRQDGLDRSSIVRAGDLVETGSFPHTFVNNSEARARLLTIKRIDSGDNHRDIFKTDKIID